MRKITLMAFIVSAALPTSTLTQTLEVAAGALGAGLERREAVRLVPDLRSTRDLPTVRLQAARKAMLAKQYVPLLTIRDLADLGDSLAAYRFADKLAEWDDPALTADVAHYYGRAAAAGRSGAIFGFIDHLDKLDPTTASEGRLRVLREVLMAYAVVGDPRAVKATVRYHLSGVPFGPMDESILAIIARGTLEDETTDGADALALQLATEILQDETADPAALREARALLEIALKSRSVSVLSIAQNLTVSLDAELATLTSITPAVEDDQ